MFRFIYAAACILGLAMYGGHAFLGYEYTGSSQRAELPSNVRQSPGGYRTYVFWHSGYRGGK